VFNSVDIGSVVNTHGVDDPFGLVDAIGHPVCASARRMIAAQPAGEGFAGPDAGCPVPVMDYRHA
jgi:hypothetical protein